MCRVKRLRLRGGGAVSSAGGREADRLRCKDAKRQRSEASIVKIFPLSGEGVQCVGCTPHPVLRTTFSHTGEKEEIVASPFTLHSLLKHKAAFTPAEGATHVAHSNNTRRAAFTLAEVLITLGIIGVVAAMTMPTLIHKTQNKQLQTAFKSAYSILSQTISYLHHEYGDGLVSYYTYKQTDADGNFISYPNASKLQDDFYNSANLKVVGDCEYSGKVMNYNRTNEAYIDRGTRTPDKALANGMCFNLKVNASLINLSVDVNGLKGPNQLGHDIFFFKVDEKDALVPIKKVRDYTEDELKDLENSYTESGMSDELKNAYLFQAGNPCSVNSSQRGNGLGCAYYALVDQNPDDPSKGYWESLP